MAARYRRERSVDYWPGFVDALSTLVLGIIFLLVALATGAFRGSSRFGANHRETHLVYTGPSEQSVDDYLKEGDACIGHDCPVCGFPFEIGERVSGDDVRHEKCAGRV